MQSAMNTSVARFRYHGTGGSLLWILIANAFLSIITLGFYSAWARTKVRRFHYTHTEFDGSRFEWHGTGNELFSGAIKAGLILFGVSAVFGVANLALGGQEAPVWATAATNIGLYVSIGLLVVFAVNNARRYRLSRSSWGGIRFSYHGKSNEFLAMMIRGILLSIVTLGFYTPLFQNQRRAFLVNNSQFGTEPFMYDGDGRELFAPYIRAVLLTIPTLGLYWIWYSALKQRYFWEHTTMRGGRFGSSVTGGDLLSLHFTNALLVIFTLGIGAPWAIVRAHELWCGKMELRGTVDFASIHQRSQEAAATGEGIAEGMDVDIGIGM
jgi:uncharacterized membrane protein YjgN (DUF898 family)